jgi:hypothetical protein
VIASANTASPGRSADTSWTRGVPAFFLAG